MIADNDGLSNSQQNETVPKAVMSCIMANGNSMFFDCRRRIQHVLSKTLHTEVQSLHITT